MEFRRVLFRSDGAVNLRATVVSLSYLGSVVEVKSRMADGTGFYTTISNRELGAMRTVEPGKEVYIHFRSEERRVGKECVSTCRSRWSRYHYKKTKKKELEKVSSQKNKNK